MATANLMETYMINNNLSSTQKTLTSLGTLLMGSYPFINVKMADALFNGYNDPLISLLNSDAFKFLTKALGKSPFGFDVPSFPNIGFFPQYNHSIDSNYTATTGKSDYNQISAIQTWGDSESLGWWSSDSANNITGTSDGSYWGGFLDKDTSLKTFQSYTCRKLELFYDYDTTIDDIPSRLYTVDDKTYDTTLLKNDGYVVENTVNKTFFENWGNNHPKNKFGNVAFPPGLIEQRCFPGRKERLPFLALLSNPHFLGAGEEVMNTVKGLRPDPEKHNAGKFHIQPTVGSTLDALMRLQFSVAMFNDPHIL